MEGALFPKGHSHDSLTSESFPFLLRFSPSLHSAQLQFPFSISFFSIHQSPQRAGDALQPPVSVLLASSSWTQVVWGEARGLAGSRQAPLL